MATIKELFPDMPSKKRSMLGEMIKAKGIKPIGKVAETHLVNDYHKDDYLEITMMAANPFFHIK